MYVCIGYILHTCTQVYATFDTLHVGLDSLSRRRGGWERGGEDMINFAWGMWKSLLRLFNSSQ